MPTAEILFGEWLPDAPDYKNPGCVVADNVIPQSGGSYGPFAALDGQGEALTAEVKGAEQLFDNSGGSILVGGTDTSLFIRRSSITETTGLNSLGADEAWDFAQFNNFVIATGAGNAPQYIDGIDADNTWSALPGSPPTAKRCAKVSDFLMLGNISGAPNRIQWCGINNPTGSWGASRTTQAGSLDLPPEYGEVQKIVGGRYALVFQRRAIHRLTYVGPPQVWSADVISDERGAVSPFSVVTIGAITFFFAQDGWYMTNGTEVQPIGQQRVNEWFLGNVGSEASVQGAVDWANESIMWSFTSSNASSKDRILIYSWAQNRWSTATVSVAWLVGSRSDGINLEELDAIYENLDNIPVSLDSDLFKQGDRVLGAFFDNAGTASSVLTDESGNPLEDESSNELTDGGVPAGSEYGVFNGTPLEATWSLGEFQPMPAQYVFVSEVFPLMEATDWDMTARLTARNRLGAIVGTASAQAGWAGYCPVRGEGQKMSVTLTKPSGEWTSAQGVQVKFRPTGRR